MKENARTVRVSERLLDKTKFFLVGAVAGTHALKGEVRVFPLTEDPDRFTVGLSLILDTERGEEIGLIVERSRRNGKFVLVKFEGYDTIESVERFAGKKLYIDRRDAIPLEEGEYYVADLIGLDVFDEAGARVGTLSDVISTGANDVYAVALDEAYVRAHTPADEKKTPKEILLPAIPDCILGVDPDNHRMTVHVMPGLL